MDHELETDLQTLREHLQAEKLDTIQCMEDAILFMRLGARDRERVVVWLRELSDTELAGLARLPDAMNHGSSIIETLVVVQLIGRRQGSKLT